MRTFRLCAAIVFFAIGAWVYLWASERAPLAAALAEVSLGLAAYQLIRSFGESIVAALRGEWP